MISPPAASAPNPIPRKPVGFQHEQTNLIEADSEEIELTKDETDQSFTKRQKKDKRLLRFNRIVRRFWLWEILACLFNLICLAVIVAILHKEDGRFLDDWSLKISPTALLSFVAALIKSSLLLVIAQVLSQLKWLYYAGASNQPLHYFSKYDSASRGPLGSLKLLFSSRKLLTIAAALVTILALLIDPFVQLVFQFSTELSVDVNSQPGFRQISSFDPNSPYIQLSGGDNDDYINTDTSSWTISSIRGDVIRSIIQGLEKDDIPMEIDCATGNCTWTQPISTLGVCGSCEDVTSQLQIHALSSKSVDQHTYNFTFQSGLWNGVSLLASPYTRFNATAIAPGHLGMTNLGTNGTGNLVAFAAIQVPQTNATNATAIKSSRGWQCELHYCQKTYEDVGVVLGNNSVSDPNEVLLHRCPTSQKDGINVQELRASQDDCGNEQTSSSPIYYTKDIVSRFSLPSLLTSLFTTDWTHGQPVIGEPPLTSGSSSEEAYRVFLRNTGLNTFFPPVAVILGTSDLNAAINKVADSMTETMRTGTNSSMALGGIALVPRTVIRIRWWSLILPFALILISAILLATTAIKTNLAKIPSWKNDTLAVLMHHLSDFEYTNIPPNADVDDLKAVAKGVRTRLQPGRSMVFATAINPSEVGARRLYSREPVLAMPLPVGYKRESTTYATNDNGIE